MGVEGVEAGRHPLAGGADPQGRPAGQPRDLDNLAKAALDLLQAHGVVENDVSVVDLRLLWDRTVPKGHIHITAWRTIAPASRIGAETRAKVSAATRAAFSKGAAA